MKISLPTILRRLAVFIFLLILRVSVSAQPVTVKGIVKTAAGEPFFNVSVKGIAEKKEVFTGPDGLFSIDVSPLSVVRISFPNYVVLTIKVKYSDIDTTIVLTLDRTAALNTDNVNDERKQQDLQSALSGPKGNSNIYGAGINPSSSMLPVFSQKENTEGSRYLYDRWQKGFVVNAQQTLIDNPGFYYNYDKISGELLLSQDQRTAVAIGQDQISRFCIINDMRDSLQFTIIPQINNKLYAALLVNGNPYRLYRVIETKLNKADYHTDGMTESGNKFDEFTDTRTYYLQQADGDRYQKLKMTRKALKGAFPKSAAVDSYFSSHNLENVDEFFIKGLVNAANGR